MNWKEKLTKSELKHLRESGVTTLSGAKRNAAHQAKLRKLDSDPACEPCWVCKRINNKLGLPL